MIEEKRGEGREGAIRNKDDEDSDSVRDFVSCTLTVLEEIQKWQVRD